jgi:hypothetical protein
MEPKFKLANYASQFPFILFYQGNYLEAPTISIIAIVEQHFKLSVNKFSLKTAIYTLVEALQNIERYSAHVASSEDFALIYSDNQYLNIYTQNMIKNDKINELKNKLDSISIKDKEELRQTYKDVLASDTLTEKGVGLGLIELARKSKNNLSYSFEKKTEEYSTYSLSFSISFNDEKSENENNVSDTSNILETLKENFNLNSSTLYYGGDFSNNFIKSLLDLLKKVKKEEKNSINTKTHHLLIELSQNIKKHAYKSSNQITGQLFLEWKDDLLALSTYNLLEKHNKNQITEKINLLIQKNKDELKEMIKFQLSDFSKSDGLGLIDISTLIFPEKIEFCTNKKNEELYELILTTKLNYG